MRRRTMLAFPFVVMVGCETPSAPPSDLRPGDLPSMAVVVNEKFDISGTLFNPCPPTELIAYNGALHVLVQERETPSSIEFKFHVNTQGVEGVGLTSGDRYRVLQNVKETFEVSVPPGSFEDEFDFRFRMIRQGSNDNLWNRITVRVTSPPFTVEVIRQELECRG